MDVCGSQFSVEPITARLAFPHAPRASSPAMRTGDRQVVALLKQGCYYNALLCINETHAIPFGVSERNAPPPTLVTSTVGTTWTTRRRGPHRASHSRALDATASSSLSSPPRPPPPPSPTQARDMCTVACPSWVRHPCGTFLLTMVFLCAVAVVIRLLATDPSTGVPRARRLLFDDAMMRFVDDTPRRGPRRALLFSPLKPVTGFLPAEPYEFSSWSPWQPRTWSFNVNDEAVGSIQARKSGYTGFGWSGQASIPYPREDEEDEQ